MVGQGKQISVSIETEKIRDLRNATNDIARDMVSISRDFLTSSKTVIVDLEKQIELIKERNDLNAQYGGGSFGGGGGGANGLSSSSTAPNSSAIPNIVTPADKTKIALSRELIAVIKTQTGELKAALSGGSGTGSGVGGSNVPPPISPDDTEGGEDKPTSTEKKDKKKVTGQGAIASVVSSENAFSTVSSGISSAGMMKGGMIGAAIMGAGMVAGRGIDEARRLEEASKPFARNYNTGIDNASQFAMKLPSSDYGLSPSESMDRFTKYSVSRGGQMGSGEEFKKLLASETNLGVDANQIQELVALNRFNGQSTAKTIVSFENYLRKTDQNIAVLPEILRTYNSVANNLLQVSTTLDVNKAAETVSSIGMVTGAKGSDVDQWSRGISSMGKSSNPVVKSMLFQSLRRKHPEAEYDEIMAMMEHPETEMEAVGDVFNTVKKRTGGGMAERMIQQEILGGNVSLTNLRANKGDLSELGYKKQTLEGGEGSQINKPVANYTSPIDMNSKDITEFFTKLGETVRQGYSYTAGQVSDYFGGTDYHQKQVQINSEAYLKALKQYYGE